MSRDPVEELAHLAPSTIRVWLGMIATAGLALVLIVIASTMPELSLLIRAFFILIAFGAGIMAKMIWHSGQQAVVLTSEGLKDNEGRVIALCADIRDVDRGFTIFKPSHGFLVHLKAPAQRAWVPGLWWRMGRRIGIGGATPPGSAKAMADILSVLIKED